MQGTCEAHRRPERRSRRRARGGGVAERSLGAAKSERDHNNSNGPRKRGGGGAKRARRRRLTFYPCRRDELRDYAFELFWNWSRVEKTPAETPRSQRGMDVRGPRDRHSGGHVGEEFQIKEASVQRSGFGMRAVPLARQLSHRPAGRRRGERTFVLSLYRAPSKRHARAPECLGRFFFLLPRACHDPVIRRTTRSAVQNVRRDQSGLECINSRSVWYLKKKKKRRRSCAGGSQTLPALAAQEVKPCPHSAREDAHQRSVRAAQGFT